MDKEFTAESVLRDARAVDGLDDFGADQSWKEPLEVLLDSYRAAPLSDLGQFILRGGVVHSLTMRLRANEWFRRHPEIAHEQVVPPVVVVGMMRSGTTLVQRLLAADNRHYCAYGWEVGQVAPPLDIEWNAQPDPRIAGALEREEQSRTFVPDLFAIHPMYANDAEEEIMFLADAFLSHVPEASAQVPAYRSWIDTQSFAPAYQHLHRMIQLLQWQKRRRGEECSRWVLKTPAHLGYLDDLLAVFPDAHVVHLHRDPVRTIASGASLNSTLWRMHTDEVDPAMVGAQWIDRMAWTSGRAMETRERLGPQMSVTDLDFGTTVEDPLASMAEVYADLGVELGDQVVGQMTAWLDMDAKRKQPSHRYEPEDFGLSEGQIRERFSAYISKFLS